MYVVEGQNAIVHVIRDPRSDYTGAFSVDYATSDLTAISTGPNRDYLSLTGTLNFAAGEMSKSLSIPTYYMGGSTITGIDAKITKLETAEAFNITLSNVVAADPCTNKYFIDPANPVGYDAASVTPTHQVVILDRFTYSVSSVSVGGGGGGGAAPCTFTSVVAALDLTALTLTVDSASSNTDKIIKVYNSDTGVLLGIIPAQSSGVLDVSGQSVSGSNTLNITYESCGCCVVESYAYPCSWVSVTGDIECCNITNVTGAMSCCSISHVSGDMSCCSISSVAGSMSCCSISYVSGHLSQDPALVEVHLPTWPSTP